MRNIYEQTKLILEADPTETEPKDPATEEVPGKKPEEMRPDAVKTDAEPGDEEVPAPKKKPAEKEFLGNSGENSFYLLRKTDEGDSTTDLIVADAEGKELLSAKRNDLAVTDEKAFILQAAQELDIDRISYDIMMNYFAKEEDTASNVVEPQPSLPEEPKPVESPEKEVPKESVSIEDLSAKYLSENDEDEQGTVLSSDFIKYSAEDMSHIVNSKLGGMIRQQFDAIIDGAPMEKQNSNALRMIAQLLKSKGEVDVAEDIMNYLNADESRLAEAQVNEQTGLPVGSKVVSPEGEEFLVIDSALEEDGVRNIELFSFKLNAKAGKFREDELKATGWRLPELPNDQAATPETPEMPDAHPDPKADKTAEPPLPEEGEKPKAEEAPKKEESPKDMGESVIEEGKELRKISDKELNQFANRPGVKKIAVENFLSTVDGLNSTEALANLAKDAALYKWNPDTVMAIKDGIKVCCAPISEATLYEDKDLESLRADIQKEVKYVDKKPFSHNLISLSLQQIANKFGKAEANKAIDDFGLDKKGWNKVAERIKESEEDAEWKDTGDKIVKGGDAFDTPFGRYRTGYDILSQKDGKFRMSVMNGPFEIYRGPEAATAEEAEKLGLKDIWVKNKGLALNLGLKKDGVKEAAEDEYHFGFQDKTNANKAKAAIMKAGISFTADDNMGIYYMYFKSAKDIKAAEKIALKVIDKSKEDEWNTNESLKESDDMIDDLRGKSYTTIDPDYVVFFGDNVIELSKAGKIIAEFPYPEVEQTVRAEDDPSYELYSSNEYLEFIQNDKIVTTLDFNELEEEGAEEEEEEEEVDEATSIKTVATIDPEYAKEFVPELADREVASVKEFPKAGTFDAISKAEEFLKDSGYTKGSMYQDYPIGFIRPEKTDDGEMTTKHGESRSFVITKWDRLSGEQKDMLDGIIVPTKNDEGDYDFREGGAKLLFFSKDNPVESIDIDELAKKHVNADYLGLPKMADTCDQCGKEGTKFAGRTGYTEFCSTECMDKFEKDDAKKVLKIKVPVQKPKWSNESVINELVNYELIAKKTSGEIAKQYSKAEIKDALDELMDDNYGTKNNPTPEGKKAIAVLRRALRSAKESVEIDEATRKEEGLASLKNAIAKRQKLADTEEDKDMKRMYLGDVRDLQSVVKALEAGDMKAFNRMVNKLETEVRELLPSKLINMSDDFTSVPRKERGDESVEVDEAAERQEVKYKGKTIVVYKDGDKWTWKFKNSSNNFGPGEGPDQNDTAAQALKRAKYYLDLPIEEGEDFSPLDLDTLTKKHVKEDEEIEDDEFGLGYLDPMVVEAELRKRKIKFQSNVFDWKETLPMARWAAKVAAKGFKHIYQFESQDDSYVVYAFQKKLSKKDAEKYNMEDFEEEDVEERSIEGLKNKFIGMESEDKVEEGNPKFANVDWTRKPTSWDEIDSVYVNPDDLSKLQTFGMEDVYPDNPRAIPTDDFYGEGDTPQYFILDRNGKKYLINTEGFNYARYVVELKPTNESIADGKWHHIAVTVNEGKRTLYIDGKLVDKTLCESYKMNFEEISQWMTGEDQELIDEMKKFLECEESEEVKVLEDFSRMFEVSPAGWENAIKGMKKRKEIDNPWALSYWMKNKGFKPRRKK